MKILSPAGNFECLKAAVYNGADEVYLGINNFNARNNIDGFTLNNLKQAIDFAHVYDVKVLLAINILFSNEEMQDAVNTIVNAYNLGIDAFIIQDFGLANIVHTTYPEIELHASTQMGIHNLEGVQYLERFGFKRVVLARETPLDEIKRIKENSNVEIEYFVQGALCVSFSGNCYLSSYLCEASGNRGKCKQLCRLPYTLQKDGKDILSGYLLSAKDFNMTEKLEDLKLAGVDIIKIEGRARRPFYVASATAEYYNALNNLQVNQNNLKLGFNRNYTEGYFNGNGQIISKVQNHIGIYIGNVENVIKKKTFNEVYFSSIRELSPKSTFKIFRNNSELSTLTAYDLKKVNNLYKLTTTQSLNKNDKIHLIVDAKIEEEFLSRKKRTPVLINISLVANKPITAFFNLYNKEYVIEGEVCQKAINQPTTIEDLKGNFNKSEYFDANLNVLYLDNVFLTKQQLNAFRRSVFDMLYYLKTNITRSAEKHVVSSNYRVKQFDDFEVINNLNELSNKQNIIYSPETYNLVDIQNFIKLCKKTNKTPYLDLPNFALKNDIVLFNNIIQKTNINIVANNYYALTFKASNIVIGAGLNVYNKYTAQVFDLPIITSESNISNRINYPYMTLRHCPMKNLLNADCSQCPYSNNYTYKMENGKILKLQRKKLSTCTFYLTD